VVKARTVVLVVAVLVVLSAVAYVLENNQILSKLNGNSDAVTILSVKLTYSSSEPSNTADDTLNYTVQNSAKVNLVGLAVNLNPGGSISNDFCSFSPPLSDTDPVYSGETVNVFCYTLQNFRSGLPVGIDITAYFSDGTSSTTSTSVVADMKTVTNPFFG